MRFQSILLFSGGIDSYLSYLYLNEVVKEDVTPIYYNIGTRYSREEVEHIQSLSFSDKVVFIEHLHLGDLEQEDAFVPNRNILLATHASSMSDKIWIGGSLSDRVGDNKQEVFEYLSDLLTKVNGRLIKVTSLFWNSYKCDLVSSFIHYFKLCSYHDLVSKTFSCYRPTVRRRSIQYLVNGNKSRYETKECLNCPACFRKGTALFSAGLKRPFYNKQLIEKYETDFRTQIENTPRKLATISYCSYLKEFLNLK